MITPLAIAEARRIGSVDFVSPDEINVLLDIEAPNDVALNAGVPRPFPRINSYVVIANDNGYLVAQVEWIRIERSPYPKRKGLQDFGVIDLPFPLRKMSLNPLGILRENVGSSENPTYSFSRGVDTFPTVGDPVLLPSQTQLKCIIESGENRRVKIGVSPLAGNAEVCVDPDRLFGRHLAILGNTGSGKSCSVAGIIRWSIDAAKRELAKNEYGHQRSNSHFIVLDPNGEYMQAFSDLDNVRFFSVKEDKEKGVEQLQVPLWLWNSTEWCAFTQASSRTQRPVLIQALRTVRDGAFDATSTPSADMRRYLRTLVDIIRMVITSGDPWAIGNKNFGRRKGFFDGLNTWKTGLTEKDSFTPEEKEALSALNNKINEMISVYSSEQYPSFLFDKPTVEELLETTTNAYCAFGGSDRDVLPIDSDVPRPFTGESFLRSIQVNAELLNFTDYVETMLTRIRTLLSDSRMKIITECPPELTLQKWLETYICPSNSVDGSITVIDLSLIPTEVIHIVTAVIARMTFEALQRYRNLNDGKTLPTTLVMEEAHTFIRKYTSETEGTSGYSMCTQVFEKIAREGRKFGLGLVLSSQRPSELSQTVLSQCNTFLLHRISNDRDQDLVKKLVPDNLRGLLRELPSLPSRKAILLGWASELPVLVQMNYLEESQKPKSDDPMYWKVWTNSDESPRIVDWGVVANLWQEKEPNTDEDQGSEEVPATEQQTVNNAENPAESEDSDLPF